MQISIASGWYAAHKTVLGEERINNSSAVRLLRLRRPPSERTASYGITIPPGLKDSRDIFVGI
jgi:hypothetical protein